MPTNRPGLGDDTERYYRVPHGYIEWRFAPGNTVEIVNIEVEADHRHKGVGKKMLEGFFRTFSYETLVYAITRSDNEIAQLFYEACLFNVVNPLRRFYGGDHGVDAIMYGRKAGGPI